MSASEPPALTLEYAVPPGGCAEIFEEPQRVRIILSGPPAWRVVLPRIVPVVLAGAPLVLVVAGIAGAFTTGQRRISIGSPAALAALIGVLLFVNTLALFRLVRAMRRARMPIVIFADPECLGVFQPVIMNAPRTWPRAHLLGVSVRARPSLLGGWKLLLAIAAHSRPREVALTEEFDSSARFVLPTRQPELARRMEIALTGKLALRSEREA